MDKCGGGGENGDEGDVDDGGGGIGRDRVRIGHVFRVRRIIVRARPLRRNHVRTNPRPHVSRPRRARDPPAQRHRHREEASRYP